VVGVFPGEGSLVNLAEGHGRLGFPALPGHEPALDRGRKTHKNRNLTLINTEALIEKFLRIVPESQERFSSFYTF
jgi:hypothetical protein